MCHFVIGADDEDRNGLCDRQNVRPVFHERIYESFSSLCDNIVMTARKKKKNPEFCLSGVQITIALVTGERTVKVYGTRSLCQCTHVRLGRRYKYGENDINTLICDSPIVMNHRTLHNENNQQRKITSIRRVDVTKDATTIASLGVNVRDTTRCFSSVTRNLPPPTTPPRTTVRRISARSFGGGRPEILST